MMTALEKYTQQLTLRLRMLDVPGEVIADAVAQVESHIADTGEDPVEAFGTVSQYAAAFTPARTPVRRWWSYALTIFIGLVLGAILAIGIVGLALGDDLAWEMKPWILVVTGLVGIVVFFSAIIGYQLRRMRDPRRV